MGTSKRRTPQEKARIVLVSLNANTSAAELCRKHNVASRRWGSGTIPYGGTRQNRTDTWSLSTGRSRGSMCGRTVLRASRMPRSFWQKPLWTTTRTGSTLRWAILRPASLSASWMVGINGGRIHSEKSAESGIKNRGPDHNRGKWHPKDATLQINRICKRTHSP